MTRIYRMALLSVMATMGEVGAFHSHFGLPCVSNIDCTTTYEYCNFNEGAGTCAHKDLWPMEPLEFWGMLFVFGIIWITNIAGLGGGGIVVPISVIFFKFDAKNAIALSNFSIFASSTQRWILKRNTPHPLKNGKGLLVDYNVGVLMLPGIISGVSIGSTINLLTP